jgi:hypothetical protein
VKVSPRRSPQPGNRGADLQGEGATEGAVTGTFEIECPTGKNSDWSEEVVQTCSSGTKLTVKVTISSTTSEADPYSSSLSHTPFGHADSLVLSALAADTAAYICPGGAVLKVAPASSCQGSVQRCRPFGVGLAQSPHLVRGQA